MLSTVRQAFVHGHAVVPERTDGLLKVDGVAGTDVSGYSRGWGKTFRLSAGTLAWFHVALPTMQFSPSVYVGMVGATWISDVLPAGGPIGVDRMHLWDGNQRLWRADHPAVVLAGDWSFDRRITAPDGTQVGNSWSPFTDTATARVWPRPKRGLGVSLHVVATGEGSITFHSAWCWLTETGFVAR